MNGFKEALNNYFEIDQRGSTVRREIIAGLTIFLSMSYILFVMPSTYSHIPGMETNTAFTGAVFTATAISGCIASLLMGLYAKYPIALAPGMGMQAFFVYTIILDMGYSWENALFGIFVSGIIFMILSLTGLRKQIINSIPGVVKHSVTVGIGFFIAFIGMQNVAMIIADPEGTIVKLGDLTNPITLVAIIGTLVTFILISRKMNLGIFIGMIVTVVIGLFVQLMGADVGISLPKSVVSAPPSISPIFGHLFEGNPLLLLTDIRFWVVVFSILFVDFFDTAGTLLAVGNEAGTVDENGEIKDSDKVLLVDSTSTVIGSVLGVSSVTSYIESLTGIKLGGRTGLSAVVVGICFFFAIFFSPLLSLVGNVVTAPALITIGAMMAMNNVKIDYSDFVNASTAFITIAIIVLSYSISNGLAAGIVVYVVLRVFQGKAKEIPVLMYVLSVLFLIYFTVI